MKRPARTHKQAVIPKKVRLHQVEGLGFRAWPIAEHRVITGCHPGRQGCMGACRVKGLGLVATVIRVAVIITDHRKGYWLVIHLLPSYLGVHGDSLSRLIMTIVGVIIWLIGVTNG